MYYWVLTFYMMYMIDLDLLSRNQLTIYNIQIVRMGYYVRSLPYRGYQMFDTRVFAD